MEGMLFLANGRGYGSIDSAEAPQSTPADALLPRTAPHRPCTAHPHTKLATLVYCESLCSDVGLVQVRPVEGHMWPGLAQRGR